MFVLETNTDIQPLFLEKIEFVTLTLKTILVRKRISILCFQSLNLQLQISKEES